MRSTKRKAGTCFDLCRGAIRAENSATQSTSPVTHQGSIILGLTTLGLIHTAISLIAVISGLLALVRRGDISPATTLGKVYLWTTVLTCLTAFGIFQHGGFGKPHMLAILTLVTLAIASVAERTSLFGRLGRYIITVCYSTTMLFHFIPAATETFTRLPAGQPLFSSPDDPALQHVIAVMVVILFVGLVLQIRHLRSTPAR